MWWFISSLKKDTKCIRVIQITWWTQNHCWQRIAEFIRLPCLWLIWSSDRGGDMRLFKNVRSLLLNSSGTKGQRIAFLIAHCPESLGKMPQMSKYPGQGGKFEFVISPLAWPALAWLALNSQHFASGAACRWPTSRFSPSSPSVKLPVS